jgi:hypothetical protein
MADTPTMKKADGDDGKQVAKTDKEKGPDRFQVRLTHPLERDRVVFSSVSEKRARRFVQNRYPRGEEAYLLMPNGDIESYQHEREGPHGEDADQWGEFDPASWIPPEEAAPPGDAAWVDVES